MGNLRGNRGVLFLTVFTVLIGGPLGAAWADSTEEAVSAIRQVWVNYANFVETGDAAA